MMAYFGLLLTLGMLGGFFSGLLGLGGAILMIPLLLYVPPLFNLPSLDMKTVAAISTLQVFASAASGAIAHRKKRAFSMRVIKTMGLPAAAAGFGGAFLSQYVNPKILLGIFAGISTIATFLMFVPKKDSQEEEQEPDFNPFLASSLAAIIGFIGGMIGAPGAFIFIPVCVYILNIPLRVTIGSTLGIVLLTSLMSMIGKVASGQMVWLLGAALVLGSVPAAQLGSQVSHRAPVQVLHWMMTCIVALSSLKLWTDVFK